MKNKEALELLNSITILEGDDCFLITTEDCKTYNGDELVIIINKDGLISRILLLGSYMAHSGCDVIKLELDKRDDAIELLLQCCDANELTIALSALIKGSKLE